MIAPRLGHGAVSKREAARIAKETILDKLDQADLSFPSPRSIRQPPCRLKLSSPCPLLGGRAARFGRFAALVGLFRASNLPRR